MSSGQTPPKPVTNDQAQYFSFPSVSRSLVGQQSATTTSKTTAPVGGSLRTSSSIGATIVNLALSPMSVISELFENVVKEFSQPKGEQDNSKRDSAYYETPNQGSGDSSPNPVTTEMTATSPVKIETVTTPPVEKQEQHPFFERWEQFHKQDQNNDLREVEGSQTPLDGLEFNSDDDGDDNDEIFPFEYGDIMPPETPMDESLPPTPATPLTFL